MKYFDIHSHLNFPEYDADMEAVLARMAESETATIVVGTDFESSKRAVELAEQHEHIWACIGVHPVDNPSEALPLARGGQGWGELVSHPKVVAIGECGLDYFRIDKTDAKETARQEKLFLQHVEFALEHKKPLMIHSRDAYIELLEILEPLKREHGGKLWGNVHFFAGSVDIARRFWNIGFTTSFTGVITFARNYDEVIKHAPLEMIMSETDAPFVSPAPYRGKRNEPSYVHEVVKKMAEIRGEDFEKVREQMGTNAKRVFRVE